MIEVPQEATAAWVALNEALARTVEPTPCQRPSSRHLWHGGEFQRAEAASRCQEECPVRQLCARYAEAADERFGVWGGRDFEAVGKPRDRLGTPAFFGGDRPRPPRSKKISLDDEFVGGCHREANEHDPSRRLTGCQREGKR